MPVAIRPGFFCVNSLPLLRSASVAAPVQAIASPAAAPPVQAPLAAALARPPAPRQLQLTRPLVALDLESTGFGAQAEIIEIALIELLPNGSTRVLMDQLIRPLGKVQPGAERVHHHSTASLQQYKSFAERAPEILNLLRNCDVVGHNIKSFDLPLLRRELARVGQALPTRMQVVDTLSLFRQCVDKERAGGDYKLGTAYRYYCNKAVEGAHNALPDTWATLEILQAQLARHRALPTRVAQLADFHRGRKRQRLAAGEESPQ